MCLSELKVSCLHLDVEGSYISELYCFLCKNRHPVLGLTSEMDVSLNQGGTDMGRQKQRITVREISEERFGVIETQRERVHKVSCKREVRQLQL